MDTPPGGSDDVPKRRSKTPPSTLPHLDKTNPLSFEPRYQPFSPTSPGGVKSPVRMKTLREYEEDINNLKRENFNLKVRIYFIEQSRIDQGVPKDIDELRNAFTELKYNYERQSKDLDRKEDLLLDTYRTLEAQRTQLESMKKYNYERQSKDLDSKEDLLLDTYRALEAQRTQLESMKKEHEAEKQELQNKVETLENKIDELEKDLRDYQVKFMESSLHLDDTNALYAVTFGLKPPKKDETEELHNKITELESQLTKEREEVLRLESEVAQLNSKNEKDLKKLHHLHENVTNLEQKLTNTLKEKSAQEAEQQEAFNSARKAVKKYQEALRFKETEVDSLKSKVMDFERHLSSLKDKLQDKSGSEVEASALQKHIKALKGENADLKKELRYLQQQLRSRSSGGKRNSEEENNEESATHLQVLQLQQKILELKSRPVSDNPGYQGLVQTLVKESKTLKKAVEELKSENLHLRCRLQNSAKEEVASNFDAQIDQMTSEKDHVISVLNQKIEELNQVINDQEQILQEYKSQLQDNAEAEKVKTFEEKCLQETQDTEKNTLQKELEEQKKEVESLKKELKKKTYNLQGLVNTELWDKNREIEKLNKVCERKHMEVLALQKQLREFPLTLMQEKMRSVQTSIFTEDKENLEPLADPRTQIQQLSEENRLLDRKVKELEARLLNTPERDTESSLVQTLRQERDNAERLRKEAVNACVLLTTRLQELADFLDSLLPFLGGRKRRVVQRAVERSRELSRSLTIATEESSLQNLSCSIWTDLQPSLYIPLLPDISTVDFWSGEDSPQDQEVLSNNEEQKLNLSTNKSAGDTKSNKSLNNMTFTNSIFNFDNLESRIFNNSKFLCSIADQSECSLLDTSDVVSKTTPTKMNAEVKSANIGTITLSSKKKDSSSVVDKSRKEGCASEAEEETWSEPDRDVSLARMGLKETVSGVNKVLSFPRDDTSETADSFPNPPSPRKAGEIQRLQRKIRNLEQMNEALRSELQILHKLAPPTLTRQDKATSIEASNLSVPTHLLEEIRNQREKLEASLFHNDYIRRQLENSMSSLRKSQIEDQEKTSLIQLKEVTNQLHLAQCELTKLKLEKEKWAENMNRLEETLQQNATEVIEKQCALLEIENKTSKKLKELEAQYNDKIAQSEKKCVEIESNWMALEKERDSLLEEIAKCNRQIEELKAEVEMRKQEGKKDKQQCNELNHKIQQISKQKDDLQRVVGEQEQLLTDAERERQELATQLIARDKQVSELQQQLRSVELTSSELEAALRSQLDVATHQCHQFEAKIRELDTSSKQVAHVERIRTELERRVAELEAVNSELESRLASLQVDTKYSDCETDMELMVGSPRTRTMPPPLSLPLALQYQTQRSHDLTSDYLSDQDPALASPQNMWFPSSPHSQASASPDLGIESDHGRLSSLETHTSKSTHTAHSISARGTPVKDLLKLEEENTQLRRNLQKTRHSLEETLAQLTAANQHKRQYEAQLSAASQHKAKVERAICHQLTKTHSILKRAKKNLKENSNSDQL